MMAKTRGHLLVEQLQVPRTREEREPERFVGCACGRVAGIAASSHGCYVHSAPTHVVERVSGELRGDASPLEVGIHADDLDHPMRSMNALRATVTNPTGRPSTTATKASRSLLVQLVRTSSA